MIVSGNNSKNKSATVAGCVVRGGHKEANIYHGRVFCLACVEITE